MSPQEQAMARSEAVPFAVLLKHYRTAAGLTQEELAERARLSTRAISDLERGINHRPQAYTIQRLQQGLDLDEAEVSQFQLAARGLGAVGERSAKHAKLLQSADLPV